MNCRGCGVEVEPTAEQINLGVDQILEASLEDAKIKGGVCPLCGHSKELPYSHRKSIQFLLLSAALLLVFGVAATFYISRQTTRAAVASEVASRLTQNADLIRLLGQPIKVASGVQGEVKQDETGWSEAHLTVPIVGPNGVATVRVVGGKGSGPWIFTTMEVIAEAQHKKLDLIAGKVVEYDPSVYVDAHTQAVVAPEYLSVSAAAPTTSGEYPCLWASAAGGKWTSQLGQCAIALPMAASASVDRYEVDLRYGSFVIRQTDLSFKDAVVVRLTRTYSSYDWIQPNPVHAFGRNANHSFDIAPVGTRNPYTQQFLVLGDGNYLYFDRISKGTGYADSVFQHTETATSFYKATTRWNGNGWTMRLQDGSSILFPESYNAVNLAQGAALQMTDRSGNKIVLVRNGRRDLQEVRAPKGGYIKLKYDDHSRIIRAEDITGHWAQYQYGPTGMLTDVVLSSGVERHYTYNGDLMTSIRDEHSQFLLRNFYGNRYGPNMLDHQQTDAGIYSYTYELSANGKYVARVVVTFPDGSTKTIEPTDSVRGYVKNL